MSRQTHVLDEYPCKKATSDPYEALATAVLKNAIVIWKNGNIRERSKVVNWIGTKGYVKSKRLI